MSGFLDFVSNIVPITGNSVVDSVLFALIGLASFAVAWYITGLLASLVGFNPNGMSLIHWIVRISVWLGLLFIISLIVSFIRWLFSFEWWVYLIILFSLLLLSGGIIALCIALKKKSAKKIKGRD